MRNLTWIKNISELFASLLLLLYETWGCCFCFYACKAWHNIMRIQNTQMFLLVLACVVGYWRELKAILFELYGLWVRMEVCKLRGLAWILLLLWSLPHWTTAQRRNGRRDNYRLYEDGPNGKVKNDSFVSEWVGLVDWVVSSSVRKKLSFIEDAKSVVPNRWCVVYS